MRIEDRGRAGKSRVLALVLALSSAAAGAISSGDSRLPLLGPGGATLSHGPMVGAVRDDGVRVWARADGNSPLTYSMSVQYGEIADPIGSISPAVLLVEGTDYTGTVEIGGLAPATGYWFRILLDGVAVPGSDGSFATLPAKGTPSAYRFGFGSCNDHLEMPYPIFSAIVSEGLAFLLHLGDAIYADRAPAATTRAQFEERYKLNFGESNWRSLMAVLPSFMIWDDHEIENDWSGGQAGLYLEARPAYEEYVASHNPPPRLPGELYYSFSAGEVDFFVLDTRSFRDPGAATMLGATQLAELESWLSASTAAFKLIVSTVQWSDLSQVGDTWFGFPAERAEIFDYVRDHAIHGVVLLSGDRHWMGVFRHEVVPGYFLYELSSSPFGAAIGAAPAPDGETLFLSDTGRGYVTIDVDTVAHPATLGIAVRDESGIASYELTISDADIFPSGIFTDGFESGGLAGWDLILP